MKHKTVLSSYFFIFLMYVPAFSYAAPDNCQTWINKFETITKLARLADIEFNKDHACLTSKHNNQTLQNKGAGIIRTEDVSNVSSIDITEGDYFNLTVSENEIFDFYKIFESENQERQGIDYYGSPSKTFWEFCHYENNNEQSYAELSSDIIRYFERYPVILTKLLTAKYICTSYGVCSTGASKILYFYLTQLLYLRKDRDFFILTRLRSVKDTATSSLYDKNNSGKYADTSINKLFNALKNSSFSVEESSHTLKLIAIKFLLTAGSKLDNSKHLSPSDVLRATFIEEKKKILSSFEDKLTFGIEPIKIQKTVNICNLLSKADFDKETSGSSYIRPSDIPKLTNGEAITFPDKKIEFSKKAIREELNYLDCSSGCIHNALSKDDLEKAISGLLNEKKRSYEFDFMKNRIKYIRHMYNSPRYNDLINSLNMVNLLHTYENSFTETTLSLTNNSDHLKCFAWESCNAQIVTKDLEMHRDGRCYINDSRSEHLNLARRKELISYNWSPDSEPDEWTHNVPYDLKYQFILNKLQSYYHNSLRCKCESEGHKTKQVGDIIHHVRSYKMNKICKVIETKVAEEANICIAKLKKWAKQTSEEPIPEMDAITINSKYCIDNNGSINSTNGIYIAIQAEQITNSYLEQEIEIDWPKEQINIIDRSSFKWSCNMKNILPSNDLSDTKASNIIYTYDDLEEQKGLLKELTSNFDNAAHTLKSMIALVNKQIRETKSFISSLSEKSLQGIFLTDNSLNNSILSMTCYEKNNLLYQVTLRPVQIILGDKLETNIYLHCFFECNDYYNNHKINPKTKHVRAHGYEHEEIDEGFDPMTSCHIMYLSTNYTARLESLSHISTLEYEDSVYLSQNGFYASSKSLNKIFHCSRCNSSISNYKSGGYVYLKEYHHDNCDFRNIKNTLTLDEKQSHELWKKKMEFNDKIRNILYGIPNKD